MKLAADELSEAGWIRPAQQKVEAGRPRSDFDINPRLKEVLK